MGSLLWKEKVCSVSDVFGLKCLGDIQEQAYSKHWVMHFKTRESNQLSGGGRSLQVERNHWEDQRV